MGDGTGRADATDEAEVADLLILQRSGLFDGNWFLKRNPDLSAPGADPLRHFHRWGWRENRWPNAYFEPLWYLAQNRDVRDRGVNPLLHYALYGEAEGRRPIAYFDPCWYRERYGIPEGTLCLAHYLEHRDDGAHSPIAEFDAVHYLKRYPDVAEAGMDPFEHYLVRGASEDREPSDEFDPQYYRSRYLRNQPSAIPLLHYRQSRHLPGVYPARPMHDSSIPHEVRRNTRPGPLFEEVSPLRPGERPGAMLLAFYLPQFHAVAENDTWWGKGFTEWTNVARALPRFAGHYQPRIPRDLGHYSLTGTEVLRRQAELARGAGIHGFVFYFYWFDGKRLLDAPLEALLADRGIDLPFCLMWANENWTRRWDGSDQEVLLAQTYRPADEAALVDTFLRHFSDPRYIRLQGRPVLMVYRAGLIPKGAVARWRARFARAGENPLFVMAQSFHDRDPTRFGMDAAVEFPPHKHTDRLETINHRLHLLDDGTTARIYDYEDIVAASELTRQPFPLIRTAIPGWDNDPRRQGAGMAVHGATPQAYQAWLERLVAAAREQPVSGEAVVCINAWNEWGEGAYLEPDVHFGAAFLNATGRAVAQGGAGRGRTRLLLVGHDAFPAGAQLLLLHVGRTLQEMQGIEVAFLLLGEGALLPRYRELAPTTVLPQGLDLALQAKSLRAQGFRTALVNSAAAATACSVLVDAGLAATLLVHELPRLLRERDLISPLQAAVDRVHRVVFGVAHVRDRVAELVNMPPERTAILAHGLYRPVQARDRARRRGWLRVPEKALLAIGIGYADLRKGFDLFLQAWRVAQRPGGGRPVHMLWVGDIDPFVRSALGAELAAAQATGSFHHLAYASDGADWFAAADVLLLTSREDPLPTVVMEAMSAGVPTVAFEEAGGAPDLIRDCGAGAAVPLGDVQAMVRQMRALARRMTKPGRAALAATARSSFDFGAYGTALVRLIWPQQLEVAAVVPSYNYARYLPDRLASIFAQSHSLAEVVVIDDASVDDSEAVTRRAAEAAGRRVRWEGAARNGGSVFRQWRRAAQAVASEWLWIAEADDLAEPGFVAALAESIARTPDAVLAFCDSRAVDAEGETLWADHKTYYRSGGAGVLDEDRVLDAEEVLRTCLAGRNMILNASAVLWRRTALLAALERCGDELGTFTMAGDWRLYAEVLAGGGRVVYVAQPLNVHRRHAASVTHRLEAGRHLEEVRRMHRHMRRVLPPSPDLARLQRRALTEARLALTASAAAPSRRGRVPSG